VKTRPFGGQVFYADRQTNRPDEANSSFSQFCGKPLIKYTRMPSQPAAYVEMVSLMTCIRK